jgi:hypothetical protein
MPRGTESPKRFIISCRVDSKEMRLLQEIAKEQAMSITSLVRQCLNLPDDFRKKQVG